MRLTGKTEISSARRAGRSRSWGNEGVRLRFWRDWAFLVVLVLAGCAPLPKVEYWGGFFRHLHYPQYSFQVPDGWQPATVSDYLSLSSSQRVFQTLDEAGRRAFIQRVELAMKTGDTVLMSPRGAWIQVKSESESSLAGIHDLNRYGLSEREKQSIWRRFSTDLIRRAPPADQLKLSLEGMEVETYGENRFLRLRFRSDATTGSMHWTVLNFYGSSSIVTVAHLGTPEDIKEGIAGLEVIVRSFRFE